MFGKSKFERRIERMNLAQIEAVAYALWNRPGFERERRIVERARIKPMPSVSATQAVIWLNDAYRRRSVDRRQPSLMDNVYHFAAWATARLEWEEFGTVHLRGMEQEFHQ